MLFKVSETGRRLWCATATRLRPTTGVPLPGSGRKSVTSWAGRVARRPLPANGCTKERSAATTLIYFNFLSQMKNITLRGYWLVGYNTGLNKKFRIAGRN